VNSHVWHSDSALLKKLTVAQLLKNYPHSSNQSVHRRHNNSLLQDRVLNWITPVNILTHCLSKNLFNVSLPSTSRFLCFLPFSLFDYNIYRPSHAC
jgi:hypothetical protein